jgi:hypothetical protein
MDLQHPLFELEEKGIYKKREVLQTPPVRRCQLFKTPPQNKILCTLLTATVSDRANAI